VDQIIYGRAPLQTSDHRPVLALFRAGVQRIDRAKKASISSEIRRGLLGQGHQPGAEGSLEERLLAGLKMSEKRGSSLPLPSSEQSQWWAVSEGGEGDGFAEIVKLEPGAEGTGSRNPWAEHEKEDGGDPLGVAGKA
jgi:hypothetical protein